MKEQGKNPQDQINKDKGKTKKEKEKTKKKLKRRKNSEGKATNIQGDDHKVIN